MVKFIKHFIRYINSGNGDFSQKQFSMRNSESIIEKYGTNMEDARNKLSFELQGSPGLVCFQFFDKGYITIDGIKYESEPYNFSPIVYFGQRMTQCVYNDGIKEEKQCCYVDGIYYVLRDIDMSYDEYIECYSQQNNNSKVKKKIK